MRGNLIVEETPVFRRLKGLMKEVQKEQGAITICPRCRGKQKILFCPLCHGRGFLAMEPRSVAEGSDLKQAT